MIRFFQWLVYFISIFSLVKFSSILYVVALHSIMSSLVQYVMVQLDCACISARGPAAGGRCLAVVCRY